MDTFSERTNRAFRLYRAVLICLNTPSVDELARLDESLKNIELMRGPLLREKAKTFKKAFAEVVRRYGVKGSLEQFESLQDDWRNATRPVAYVARYGPCTVSAL
jgi:hypothetical protein